MRVTTAYNRMLGLPGAWVRDVEFGAQAMIVTVALRRRRPVCSGCGARELKVKDHRVKRWRHLDVGGVRCMVECRLRRPYCPGCGDLPEHVEWARGGARYVARVAAKGDPGYASAAVMIGEAALRLALDRDWLPQCAGILTPVAAMNGALIERLRAAGRARVVTSTCDAEFERQLIRARTGSPELGARPSAPRCARRTILPERAAGHPTAARPLLSALSEALVVCPEMSVVE